MLDKYFRYPILTDIILGLMLNLFLWVLYKKSKITLPEAVINISLSTDISSVSLTLAGFVLTFLTIIITFKTAAKTPDKLNTSDTTVFDRFFSSSYYDRTIELLKGAIVILIFVAVLGFFLKLVLRDNNINYIFFSNCFGVLIIITTLLRSLTILSNIVKLQKGD